MEVDPRFYGYNAATLPDAMQAFLKNGGDVNATFDCDGVVGWKETPLHFAVKAKNAQIVKLLLDAGADANKTSDANIKPLLLACKSDPDEEVLKIANLLLDYGADLLAQDDDGNSAVHHAFFVRNSRLVELLLARLPKGANLINHQNLSIFHIACAHGADQVVRDLLDSGVQIDHYTDYHKRLENRMNGLKFAIIDNRKSTVELLLHRGADVRSADASQEMLLHLACECNYEKFVAHCNGQYVIMRKDMKVSRENHVGIIKLLLDQGLDVNAIDRNGLTPLLYMCTDRYSDEFVWRAPIVLDNDRWNNLSREYVHISIRRDRILKLLLERGAAIDARQPDGRSVIHLEVVSDIDRDQLYNAGILRLFVKHGADVNARDERGFTPLHVLLDEMWKHSQPSVNTFTNVHRGIVQLLANGADLFARSADGMTPFALYVKYFEESENDGRYLGKLSNLVTMATHAQRLQMLGLTVDDPEIRNWLEMLNLADEKKKCIDELSRMKEDFVGDTSLYRLLRSGRNVEWQSLDEAKLREVMISKRITEKYPHYANLFEVQVRKGQILQRADSVIKAIAGRQLPHLCTETIMRYLEDTDLKNLAGIVQNNSEKAD